MLRAAIALSIIVVLGIGAALAEQLLGPLGRAMEVNLLLLGVALVVPVVWPWLS